MNPLLKKWIRAVAENDHRAPRTLLMGGVPGVGKTFAMRAMARWLWCVAYWSRQCPQCGSRGFLIEHENVGSMNSERRVECRCKKGRKSFSTFEIDSYRLDGPNLTDIFTRAARNDYDAGDFPKFRDDLKLLISVNLLCIDDLGGERNPPPSFEPGFRSLINQRNEAGRFTLMTCNLTAAEIKERLGDRSFSRIMLGGAVVVMEGGDRRRETNPKDYSNWRSK